ncbi:hypothetical protein EDD27_5290 [Nonomuraea polychroma]|uniref:AAA ATPase-like protein n=1 Tax=Nonomuraea polychroma TaxID=46176 RepID=A0A438MAA5_9ACTN|nr:hypothetical protein [Nonomuraea polychroma]RVX42653.1 hypothetical protein EDD27_5290 [Nonomuraea polychroma]
MSGLDEQLLDRLRERRFERYPPEWLARLALLPQWTAAVSRALEFEPVADSDLIESTTVLNADGVEERTFWVRESVRPELGAYLRDHHALVLTETVEDLLHMLTVYHPALSQADAELLANWRHAVTAFHEDPSGLTLLRRVSSLMSDERLPEAARLVATARALGEVLGEPLAGASRRAEWRLGRANRQAEDAHYLRHFQRRPGLELELLGTGDDQWASHLLGRGGAGKTMLIRSIGASAAVDQPGAASSPRPFEGRIVGRVDFDHLDPRYPEDRPGEMFLALTVDLLGFVETRRAEYAYRRFLDTVDALHEEMARSERLSRLVAEAKGRMVAAFAELLIGLDKPVLLILDTCEELAKLYPPGEPAPGIDMTFELLEDLHARVPSMRVLFAGRRWLVPPPPGGPAGPLLRPRPYLRVIHVGGFTPEEAHSYLAARGVPDRHVEAVMERARSADEYNPFDLAAYADWVLSEPTLDPEVLRSAPGDPYIEQRIIGRLRDPAVVRCLGVAAELGRLEGILGREELTRLGVDADAVITVLGGQEWTRVSAYAADGRPAVVELEENLRERLRAVTVADPTRFPVHRERIGRAARAALEAVSSIEDVPAHTVLTALRMSSVEEAIALWERVEDRVVAAGAWGWAEQVTARAAAELTEAEAAGELQASVIATQAATRVHTGGGGVAGLWHLVQALVVPPPWEPMPEASGGEPPDVLRLFHRGALGRVAAGDSQHIDFPVHLIDILSSGSASAGALLAAVNSWLLRDSVDGLKCGDVAMIADLTDDPGTQAVAGAMAALVALRQQEPEPDPYLPAGSPPAPRRQEPDPVRFLPAGSPPAPRPWADWVAPVSAEAFVDLARLLVACTTDGPLLRDYSTLLRLLDQELGEHQTLSADQERLASLALLAFRSAYGLPPKYFNLIKSRVLSLGTIAPPTSWAHRQVPPLVVTHADACVTYGDFDLAASQLRTRLERAIAAADDPDTVEQCQLALLRLCRRDRDLRHYPVIRDLARHGSPRCRAEAWITLTLVTGERPGSPEEAGSWHGWWQCQDVASLSENDSRRRARPATTNPEPGIPRELYERSLAELIAFFGNKPLPKTEPAWLVRHLPWARGVASLEEAEVLALRFPAQAHLRLLEAAEDLKTDPVRSWQARVLARIAARRAMVPDPPPLPDDEDHRLSEGWELRKAALRDMGTASSVRTLPELTLTPSAPPQTPADSSPTASPAEWVSERVSETGTVPQAGSAPTGVKRSVMVATTVAALVAAGIALVFFLGPSFGPSQSQVTPTATVNTSAPSSSDPSVPVSPSVTSSNPGSATPSSPATGPSRTAAPSPSSEFPWWLWLIPGAALLVPAAQLVWTAGLTGNVTMYVENDKAYKGRRRLTRTSWGPAWGTKAVNAAGRKPREWGLPTWPISAIRLKLSSDVLVLDDRPLEFSLFGARRFRRLPATFRHVLAVGPITLSPEASDYAGPPHLKRWVRRGRSVMHVVGTPVETTDGIRLRTEMDVKRGRSSMMFAPGDPNRIFVLQAEPTDDHASPLADETRRGFARMARSLCEAGSPGVLIVPPLPDAHAREVVTLCSDWPYGDDLRLCPERLLTLQLRIRRIVARAGGDRKAQCDVILFLPSHRGDDQ